jgi:hypothetical protein
MARSIQTIQNEIVTQVQNTPEFGALSNSTTAIWRLLTYIVATAIYTLEVLFDNYKIDVIATIATMKPHTTRWYQSKVLAYQHGGMLAVGEDYYDNSALTTDQVAAMKIIKRAAVIERGDKLQIKVAKETGGFPVALDPAEVVALGEYISEIKDAGVKVEIVSTYNDSLRLTLDCYYDAKVINSNGARLDGTDAEPVQNAVKSFLRNIPFDGVLLVSDMVDALQKVEGVVSPVVKLCQANMSVSPNAWFSVDSYWTTYSGYILIDDVDLNVNFIEYDV